MTEPEAERETVITLNDAESIARIYTSRQRTLAKMRQHPNAVLVAEGNSEGMEWAEFTVPAELVSYSRQCAKREPEAYAA